MKTTELILTFTRAEFLQELHHILWVEPQDVRGTWEAGWNCRDHALVVGALAQMLGFKAAVSFGKATYVQGAFGETQPVGLQQSPHAWTMVEGGGFHDLSIRLDRANVEKWLPWPVAALSGNGFLPVGNVRFILTKDQAEFENRVAEATHAANKKTAVYFGQEYEWLSKKSLADSLNWCNSPLTDRLRTTFGEKADLHSRAVLHLFALICGETESLCGLPQMLAWEKLCQCKGDPVYRVCSRGSIL